MNLKRLKPNSIFGIASILIALFFFWSFMGFYYIASQTLKEEIKNDFLKKTRVEADILSSYLESLLSNYDYTNTYTFIKQAVEQDPDLVGVRIREFSSDLITIGETKKLQRCKDFLMKPCIFPIKYRIKSSVPIEVEFFFSTERIVHLLSSVRKLFTILSVTLLIMSEIAVFLLMISLKKSMSRIIEALNNWRTGGITKLKEKKWEFELNNLVSKILELYEEFEKEITLDHNLLLFTKEVLYILPLVKSEDDFIEKINPIIKSLFGVRICKKKCEEKGNFRINPQISLVTEGNNPAPQIILDTLKNIITEALRVINERKEKEELFLGTVKALSNVIDATSSWTRGHSERVAEISVEIGKALELDNEELEKLKLGALLHDIGKLGIPPEILNKPAKLTPEEYEKVKEHSIWGYKILEPIKAFSDIIPIVLYHHERCDGSGYPKGLKCSEIPLMAKIVAVADVIEAMTSERPYKKSYPLEEVLEYLKKESGRLFSPKVVNAALEKKEEIEEIIKRNGRGGGI